MRKKAVLVTGFEPYGGRALNPAYEAMRALDGRTIGGVPVVGRGLPVSFAALKPAITALLEEIDPAAVISLGLSPAEAVIRLERLAVNIVDYDIADNDGRLIVDAAVAQPGTAARFSTLPLRAIEQALLDAGIPARLSASAGTFLCNACLYWFLEALETTPDPPPCGFVHLPYMPEQIAELLLAAQADKRLERHRHDTLASMELSRIVAAVEIVAAQTILMLAG
jgi:pyroglutamyl-peptidase